MRTRCKNIETLLVDYIDRQLSTKQSELVQIHLKECPKCSQLKDDFCLVNDAIKIIPDITPSNSLRDNFQTMLQSEININSVSLIVNRKFNDSPRRKYFKLTLQSSKYFVIGILVVAMVLLFLTIDQDPNKQMQQSSIQQDNHTGQITTLLHDKSASNRIAAINYFEQFEYLNDSILKTLFNVLSIDENVNVRMAALNIMIKNYSKPEIKELLLTSLDTQTEPLIQIFLIKLFASQKNLEATIAIKRIIREKETDPAVREIAEIELSEM